MATKSGQIVQQFTAVPHGGLVWRATFLTFALMLVSAGIGTSLVGLQRHVELSYALDVDVPILCATSTVADQCGAAMTSWLGKPFGLPAAALGLATHLVAFLLLVVVAGGATTAAWPLVRFALVGLRAVVGVLGLALLVFLGVGRMVLGHSCEICLVMHAVNAMALVVLAMAIRAYGRRLQMEIGRLPVWAGLLALALVAFAVPKLADAAANALTGVPVTDVQRANREMERAARLDLLRPCLGQCVQGMVWTPDQVPLGKALDFGGVGKGAAYRVLSVDLTCPHCRTEMARNGLVALSDALQGKGNPVQVVVRPRAQQCNAASPAAHLGERMCWANAAFVCAYRANPAAAVAYLADELKLVSEDSYMDRAGWLKAHAGDAAAACLAHEIATGFPLVRELAQTGLRWQQAAAKLHQQCQVGLDDGTAPEKVFWCFAGLPGMAVVRPPGIAPARGVPADPAFELNAAKEQEFRWVLAEPCL